ncbi:MAG TPA: hypothetical protein VK539_08275 [Myxococcaceae bacterium]|nr:hypothetical protein [Myxococcaceae bacterium]
MNNPSPEKLMNAVQALHRVRAVEGPPGDNGQRSVWHMCPEGADLLTLVDMEGRMQRQELTLLEDHYVWTAGEGLKTGRVETGGSAKVNPAAAIVHTDVQLVPARLLRAAVALETYDGEDRYILHMKRVLSLAREGLSLRDSSGMAPMDERPVSAVTTGGLNPLEPELVPTEPQTPRREGLFMMLVLGLGFILGVALFIWLL